MRILQTINDIIFPNKLQPIEVNISESLTIEDDLTKAFPEISNLIRYELSQSTKLPRSYYDYQQKINIEVNERSIFEQVQSIFEKFQGNGLVQEIVIIGYQDHEGICRPIFDEKEFKISIVIPVHVLGFTKCNGKYCNYKENRLDKVLFHELTHVQDIFRIVSEYGTKEFERIYQDRGAANTGFKTMTEYTAYRSTAEELNDFSSYLAERNILESELEHISNDDISKILDKLAVNSAFADANESFESKFDNIVSEKFRSAIYDIRELFKTNYNRSLNFEEYEDLGKLICNILLDKEVLFRKDNEF